MLAKFKRKLSRGKALQATRELKNDRTWISSKWYLEYQNTDGVQVRIPAQKTG